MVNQLWIESVGNVIVARVRGIPSQELLRECQNRILALVGETGNGKILYDGLEMNPPSVDVPLEQWKLDSELPTDLKLKRAIVVPNTKLAYLARLAFGDAGSHRVFYNDLTGAVEWLNREN